MIQSLPYNPSVGSKPDGCVGIHKDGCVSQLECFFEGNPLVVIGKLSGPMLDNIYIRKLFKKLWRICHYHGRDLISFQIGNQKSRELCVVFTYGQRAKDVWHIHRFFSALESIAAAFVAASFAIFRARLNARNSSRTRRRSMLPPLIRRKMAFNQTLQLGRGNDLCSGFSSQPISWPEA